MDDHEILVAGAGPVGLSTALFLAERGVRVLVVDKRDPLGAPPRAGATVRTLELFRAIGLGPAVDRVAWDGPPPLRSVVKDRVTGPVRHRAAPPARYAEYLESCSPVPAGRTVTQHEIQAIALAELRRRGATVRFGAELTGLTERPGRVSVRLADPATGEEHEVGARYVVRPDGIVAWRSADLPDDPAGTVRSVLRTLLGPTGPRPCTAHPAPRAAGSAPSPA